MDYTKPTTSADGSAADNLLYWLALNSVRGIGPATYRKFLERFHNPKAIFEASMKELESEAGPEIAEAIKKCDVEKAAGNDLSLINKHAVKVLTTNDPCYPKNLLHIPDAPIILYMKGELKEGDSQAIAIVGSRACSEYGERVAENLAFELAAQGVTIISGMARGIDSSSHWGAIRGGGRTIGVIGTGVDIIYPSENKKLFEKITNDGRGAVISEFPMSTGPFEWNFPRRNRLISGLSLGVVVVEATIDSGALITASSALDQNREVFAVPGPITSFKSKGTHLLIKQGAKLVESVQDILEELKPALPVCKKVVGASPKPAINPEISEKYEKVFNLLSGEPIHIDTVIQQSRLDASQVAQLLLELELKGHIKQLIGKRFVRT